MVRLILAEVCRAVPVDYAMIPNWRRKGLLMFTESGADGHTSLSLDQAFVLAVATSLRRINKRLKHDECEVLAWYAWHGWQQVLVRPELYVVKNALEAGFLSYQSPVSDLVPNGASSASIIDIGEVLRRLQRAYQSH